MSDPRTLGFDIYANDEPDDPNPGVMIDSREWKGKALTPDEARAIARAIIDVADHVDATMRAVGTPDWLHEAAFFGGIHGGDGACEAWSRRYTWKRPDGPWAVVTFYYYPVDIEARNGEDAPDAGKFDVEEQFELLICTDLDDPGGTELWSYYEYDSPHAVAFDSEEEARAWCEGRAKSDLIRHMSWDGCAF